jgi:hypothetical protein
MKIYKLLLFLSVAQTLCLLNVSTVLCQSTTQRDQFTVAALAGDWAFGHALMLTYLDRGTGNYSHSGNIFGMKYVIKADGTFVYKFAARYGSNTIREWGAGTVALSRDLITFKFDQGGAEKYKFVALETDASGDSVLTLTQLNDSSQQNKCGHSHGYFNCTGRQEWKLRRRS